jgi:hypothetical protein
MRALFTSPKKSIKPDSNVKFIILNFNELKRKKSRKPKKNDDIIIRINKILFYNMVGSVVAALIEKIVDYYFR